MQVADFMEDAATVSAESRELAAICSKVKWESATQLRTRVLDMPAHHRHAVFAHLLTLVPLNTLLTTCPFDLLQPIAAALLRDSCAEASAEPPQHQGTSAPPRTALHLPAPAPGARSPYGAAPLTPAAYSKLFLQLPTLTQLTSVSLAGQQLGNEGVQAATMVLMHAHLLHLDLQKNKLDAFGVRTLLLSGNELLSTAAADALAPGLHALPQLTWLDVRPTRMTGALRAALKPITVMQRLELGSPYVGNALSSMLHLSHLDLGRQMPANEEEARMDNDEVNELASSLQVQTALSWLSLANAAYWVEDVPFAQWPQLQHLDVTGLDDELFDEEDDDEVQLFPVMHGDAPAPPDSNRETGLHSIARLTQLTCLCAGLPGLGMHMSQQYADVNCRIIAALPRLQRVEISGSMGDYHDVVATGLAHAPAITQLAIHIEEDEALYPPGALRALSHLQRLDLSLCADFIDDEDRLDWSEAAADVLKLTQLTSLTWSMTHLAAREGHAADTLFAGISKLQHLRELRITGVDMTAAETHRQLPTLPRVLTCLTHLQLQHCALAPRCKLARLQLGSLRRLAMHDCELRGDHLEALTAALKHSNVLEELYLGGNITWQAVAELADLLKAVSASNVWHVSVGKCGQEDDSRDCTCVAATVDAFNEKNAGSKLAASV
jgi:hypothetical protein